MRTHEKTMPPARVTAIAALGLLSLALAGCMAAPKLQSYGGYPVNVSTNDRPYFDAKSADQYYNGEPISGSQTERAWVKAWFDYDAQFARFYIENIDQLAPLAAGGGGPASGTNISAAALPMRTVFPAPIDYNARFVRYYSASNLLSRALGFRGLQSPGLAAFGLLMGDAGSLASSFRMASKTELQYRTGSSLTLIRMLPDQRQMNPGKDAEWGVQVLSGALAIPDTPKVSLFQDVVMISFRRTISQPTHGASELPPGTPGSSSSVPVELTSKPHSIYHQAPGATLYPNGVTTTLVVPHIAYQGRRDGLVSARELYEQKLRNNPLVGPEWIAIYTDRNEKGEWAVFVTRQGDNRVIEFPLPTPFPI